VAGGGWRFEIVGVAVDDVYNCDSCFNFEKVLRASPETCGREPASRVRVAVKPIKPMIPLIFI